MLTTLWLSARGKNPSALNVVRLREAEAKTHFGNGQQVPR